MPPYRDRAEAGRVLASHLSHWRGKEPLVVGVAGGGMVVAAVVARELGGALDVVAAVPFGPPDNPDLAVGAVGADGIPVVDETLAVPLGLEMPDLIREGRARAEAARRREELLRGGGRRDLGGRPVIAVDEGVAGGLALRAALGVLRRAGPGHLACAVPVGPPAVIDLIASLVEEVVCPLQPLRFHAISDWYRDFPEVGDGELARLMAEFT